MLSLNYVNLWRALPLIFIAMTLISCSGDKETPLPGKRIPILLGNEDIRPDPTLQGDVRLPAPNVNNGWPQAGGFADHANYHLSLGENLTEIWSRNIGSFDADQGLMAQPVIANGMIFVMDHDYNVRALNEETGREIWRQRLDVPDRDENAIGGGLAYYQGRLFISTGFAIVFALKADTGEEIWQNKVDGPMRGAPSVSNQMVVITTIDNQTRALSVFNGDLVWRHFGIAEMAGLRGGASPAIGSDVAIIPYSSGEVFALRINDGRELWAESLTSLQPVNAMANLADIRALPVVDRDLVYVLGHADRLMAIDLSTGVRAWEQQIGGTQMPWAGGDYVFVLSSDNVAVALTRRGGRVKWRTFLPLYEDEEDLQGRILWRGPVLAGDRLIFANNLGELISVSPYNGAVLGKMDIGGNISTLPIIANNRLYILSNSGRLTAYDSFD